MPVAAIALQFLNQRRLDYQRRISGHPSNRLNNFKPKYAAETFSKLVSVAVRYQLVGGVGGGTLEVLYSETAKAISEGKIKSPAEVVKAMTSVPGDSAFEAAFRIASISKQKIARYYLRELEIANSGKDIENTPDADPSNVNLEHVLPLTPTAGWGKEFSEEEWRSYHKRLGNMAIMAAKPNSTIGNGSFVEKQKAYAKSDFYFTNSITKFGSWTKSDIESRQSEMAALAVKHWKP